MCYAFYDGNVGMEFNGNFMKHKNLGQEYNDRVVIEIESN